MKNKLFLLVAIATTQLSASNKPEFNTFETISFNIACNKNACYQCRSSARVALAIAIQNKYENSKELLQNLPSLKVLEQDAKDRKAPFNNPIPPCCLPSCQRKAEAFCRGIEKNKN